MQVTLLHGDDLVTLSVTPNSTIQQLKQQAIDQGVGKSAGIDRLRLLFAGKEANDSAATLASLNVQDNDVIQVNIAPPTSSTSTSSTNQQQQQAMSREQDMYEMRMAMLAAAIEEDPMNVDLQRQLESMIHAKNIQDSLESAMEHNPESFGRVVMLYVPVEVNGKHIKAFVDSGAQSTIMSRECAERCNMAHLIDTRFQGVAVGVGTGKILGRVHAVKVRIGDAVFVCSFTILETSSIDMLLGLDQLRRHQMQIDLKDNVLRVYEHAVQFLPEHEIPKSKDEQDVEMDKAIKDSKTAASSTSAKPTPATASAASAARPTPSATSQSATLQQRPPAQPAATPAANTTQPQVTPQQAQAFSQLLGMFASAAAQQQQQGGQQMPLQQSAPGTRPQANQAPQQQQLSEASIAQLVNLGFTRSEATLALQQTGGNVDAAASLLFSR